MADNSGRFTCNIVGNIICDPFFYFQRFKSYFHIPAGGYWVPADRGAAGHPYNRQGAERKGKTGNAL